MSKGCFKSNRVRGGRRLTGLCAALLTTALVFVATPAVSRTWYITPDGTGDAATIQAGIDSAVSGETAPGDSVLLADGVYTGPGNRLIQYNGKIIVVRSAGGDPARCIIDCEHAAQGFRFVAGEGPGSVLAGVTIANGYAQAGGAIQCAGSSPSFVDCVFSANRGSAAGGIGGGGAVYASHDSRPEFTRCRFFENSSGGSGGAVHLSSSWAFFTGCVFFANTIDDGNGGALSATLSMASFFECTLSENAASAGGTGGGIFSASSTILLDNTIIAFCQEGEAVTCSGTENITVNCCDVYGNSGGDWVGCLAGLDGAGDNFSADPEFCGVGGAGNVYLQANSPCAPGNHPAAAGCGQIGALPVMCGSVSVMPSTWGAVKARYMD